MINAHEDQRYQASEYLCGQNPSTTGSHQTDPSRVDFTHIFPEYFEYAYDKFFAEFLAEQTSSAETQMLACKKHFPTLLKIVIIFFFKTVFTVCEKYFPRATKKLSKNLNWDGGGGGG